MSKKKKIAILGGGLGALSTAYWLTESPDATSRYEITVYQQGWRLGGKGASGRNMATGYGQRIEEHGLHIWFGFYENAFAMYRRVLKSLTELPEPKVATFTDWRKAFRPHSLVVLGDNSDAGLEQWPILFPENSRRPGRGQHPSDWGMLLESLRLGMNFFEGSFGNDDALEDFLEGFALPDWATRRVWQAETLVWRSLLRALHTAARLLPENPRLRSAASERHLAWLLEQFRGTVRRVTSLHLPRSARGRRIYVVTDLLTTVAIGILRDGLLQRGFESVDDLEFTAWLHQHGADPALTLKSNIQRVLYDLMFAYKGGQEQQPNIAAGTGARTLLLVFSGYDGAIMYKMQSGMGDTIFVPLYGLLKSRGVRFEFFHRVESLIPGATGEIEQVQLTRQAEITPAASAAGGYDPLVRIGEHDTWPARPRHEQLVDGNLLLDDPHNPGQAYDLDSRWSSWPGAGTRVLQRGQDFDSLVCAIPVAELEQVGANLVPLSATWQRMLQGEKRVATVRTQAMQLWFRKSAAELGWELKDDRMHDAVRRGVAAPLLGGYLQPFNTWCDMSQVLPREDWAGGVEPGSVAYLCGQMPDDPQQAPTSDAGYPRRQRQVVRDTARRWLSDAGRVLWKHAADPRTPTGLAQEALVAPPGVDAFDAQYFRANIDASERYVLSLAGTTKSRPPVNGPEFPNLYLAGDWVRNPVLNAGCVEATVASGMAAARAISGYPRRIVGESAE